EISANLAALQAYLKPWRTACLLRFALLVVQQRNEIMHIIFPPVKHFCEEICIFLQHSKSVFQPPHKTTKTSL
ncbi:hypothetical protein, partial [Limnobacter sp.]|nr:hypothetical protein [Limnobacter sp.]